MPIAGVKTSFLIFEKTNKGGTDKVWFYNMENDGFTLDVKRTPIEGSDIPDIIERFNHLDDEFNRKRTDKSFMVPVQEIIDNNYDLSFNKYKEIVREKVEYKATKDIFSDLKKNYDDTQKLMKELETMLKDDGE